MLYVAYFCNSRHWETVQEKLIGVLEHCAHICRVSLVDFY